MPYGVADQLWRMLPADDQAAVIAGYEASQASQGAAPPPPSSSTPPAATIPVPGHVYLPGEDVGAAAGTLVPAPPVVQPQQPPAAPPGSSTPAPGDLGDLPATDVGDLTFELFAVEAPDRNEPGGAGLRLPSTSWGDFRDYFARDQPFLGSHIRNQGQQLKGVVASDLWSPST